MTEAVIRCSTNQWTGFYMITTSVMKELSKSMLAGSVTNLDFRNFLGLKITPSLRNICFNKNKVS